MAKRTKTRSRQTYTVPSAVRMLSFISVILLGIGVVIGVIFSWISPLASVGAWIKSIAMTIGIIVLCWYSFYEARTYGYKSAWFIVWLVAVVVIVVFCVLGLVPAWQKI